MSEGVQIRRTAPLERADALALVTTPGAALFEGWSDEPGWRVILPWPEESVEIPWDKVALCAHHADSAAATAPVGLPSCPLCLCGRLQAPDHRRLAPPDAPAGAPFLGGWTGFIAYDVGAALEAATLYDETPPEPPAWFSRHDSGIVVSPDGAHYLFAPGAIIESRMRQLQSAGGWRARSGSAERPAPAAVDDSLDGGRYGAMVDRIRESIACGDVYQVNLTRRYSTSGGVDPADLYLALTGDAPPRCSALLRGHGWSIVSASPEVFLRFDARSGVAESRPIKGTIARRGDDETEIAALLASRKDDSEHLMIVDLVRNDLGRVAPPGRVSVPAFKRVRTLRHVHHLESTIRAGGLQERSLADLLGALFPAGSITGAPKRAAVHAIREMEPVPRGVYTGTIALLAGDGRSEWSVAIRTAVVTPAGARYHAGGGIVWDSAAEAEDAECRAKAVAFLEYFGETGT